MDRPDYLLSPSTASNNRPVLVLGHSLGTSFDLWQSTVDRAATLSDAEFLHEKIRGSQLRVFPCGHLACVESAEAFAKAVTEFLSESD